MNEPSWRTTERIGYETYLEENKEKIQEIENMKLSDLVIEELIQTCGACPSQWEASLKDGRMLYIRYRWGCLSVRISLNPTEDAFDAVRGVEIWNGKLVRPDGDAGDLDGLCEWFEVEEATGLRYYEKKK